MPILRSIVLSLLTSAVATAVARRMLAVSGAEEHPTGLRSRRRAPVVPMLTGNSNNRIGWVEEEHHHHHSPLPFRRSRPIE